MDSNIYQENGYADRDDYLTCLAEDFAISIDTVYCLADILGGNEDFDGTAYIDRRNARDGLGEP